MLNEIKYNNSKLLEVIEQAEKDFAEGKGVTFTNKELEILIKGDEETVKEMLNKKINGKAENS